MSGFSASSEPFTLQRDCPAVHVPYGDAVTLPAGQNGYITQSLGGSFTVYVEGSLFRVDGNDADALGKPPPAPLSVPENPNDQDVELVVWEQCAPCSIRKFRSTWWIWDSSTTSAWSTSMTAA